jgi:hypothetical protein
MQVTIELTNNLNHLPTPSQGVSWYLAGSKLTLTGVMSDVSDYLTSLTCDYSVIMDETHVGVHKCNMCANFLGMGYARTCQECLSWCER